MAPPIWLTPSSGADDGCSIAPQSGPPPPIAVVMDESIIMCGVVRVLTDAGLWRVREYARADHLLAARTERAGDLPAVVVVNLGGGQHRFSRQARSLAARYRVVAFGPRLGLPAIAELLRAGVRGYVFWDAPAARLVDAVRTVAAAELYLPPLAAGYAGPPPRQTRPPREAQPLVGPRSPGVVGPIRHGGVAQLLTTREREVLQSVSSGLTHKEIARALGLSKTTVDTYVQRVRQKLGVGNKAELARAAYRFGLCADD